MTSYRATDLATTPDTFEIARTEVLPLGVDMAALLASGESVSAPSATLTDLATGLDVTATGLMGNPSVAGTVVTTTITGALMVKDRTYRLAVNFVAGGKHWSTETFILCVF